MSLTPHLLPKLMDKFCRDRVFKNNVFATDPETLVHECAHLSTLLGVPGMKELVAASVASGAQIDVDALIKQKRKTIKGRDTNEVKTTAVTILAMEDIGGGSIRESMTSMLSNIQEMTRTDALLEVADFLVDDSIKSHATSLAQALLSIEQLV